MVDGQQVFSGTVKSFNPEKGWGHIECPETHELFGKDIFLLKSQLQGGLSVVQKGAAVTFSVTDSGRGPEATDVTVQGAFAGGGCGGAVGGYVGTIKSFNPTSGWGHITCAQTEAIYGKDIFFMKSQLQSTGGVINKGVSVSFDVNQGIKGPEASNINPTGGVVGVVGGGCSVVGGGMQQHPQAHPTPHFGYGGYCGGYGPVVGGPMAPPPLNQNPYQQLPQQWQQAGGMQQMVPGGGGGVFYGTVKSFNDDKGWGHISCQQTQAIYGKDMFVLRSQLNGATASPGAAVQFMVGQGAKGPEAHNVRVMGPGATGSEVYMGTVKNWNQEKGWGFISCDETHALYGKDIFLHKKDVGAHNPTAGENVQFSVQISEQGRPETATVSFVGASYGAWKAAPQPVQRPGPWSSCGY